MQTLYRRAGADTYFVVTDLDETFHAAVRKLEFEPVQGGFARRFPSNSPHLERIYENFVRYIEDVILQRAGMRPVPWEQTLKMFLRLADGHPINWWLAGSAALAVRGLDVGPGDVDLVTDDAGAHQIGELLLDYLIEPVTPVVTWDCKWFGRACIHACIEWIGGVDEQSGSDFGPAVARRLETVTWHGYKLHVPPLETQIEANERRGRTTRVELIRQSLRSREAPSPL